MDVVMYDIMSEPVHLCQKIDLRMNFGDLQTVLLQMLQNS